jgi:hypothetical protein
MAQIIAALVMMSCVVVFWRSQTNQIESSKYCLDDNENINNDSEQTLEIKVKDSIVSIQNAKLKPKIFSTKLSSRIKAKSNPKFVKKNSKLIVKTSSGKLEGKQLKVFGSTIYAFIGIPYAEPPIGELRFSAPKPGNKLLAREAII